MADATANRDPQIAQGDTRPYKAAAVALYAGTIISLNAAGYAKKGSDTASEKFVGIADQSVDNSTGAAGDQDVIVRARGVAVLAFSGTATVADTGKQVYIVDNQTVGLVATTTNDLLVGRIVEVVDASTVRVALTPDA